MHVFTNLVDEVSVIVTTALLTSNGSRFPSDTDSTQQPTSFLEVLVVFLFTLIDLLAIKLAAKVVNVSKGFVSDGTVFSTVRSAFELSGVQVWLYRVNALFRCEVAAACVVFVRPTGENLAKYIVAFIPG